MSDYIDILVKKLERGMPTYKFYKNSITGEIISLDKSVAENNAEIWEEDKKLLELVANLGGYTDNIIKEYPWIEIPEDQVTDFIKILYGKDNN